MLSRPRLFLILFWLFVASLVFAMVQNFLSGQSVFSNGVFWSMGICVALVLCDEVTKYLNSAKRIRKAIEEELLSRGWTKPEEKKFERPPGI